MHINLTLILQMISFAAFVWFCMTYVWPPIMQALEERKNKIAEGLAAAERGLHEQELGRQRALEVMHKAKADAAEIISQAQRRYNELLDQAKQDAVAEGQRLKLAAQAEIEQQANRAREELRERFATLTIAAAEKILQQEINAGVHKNLLDTFAKQI
ncbi:F0F1 ATP synthase subunit B [Rhodoferax sp. 4810]|uniref:ATP synthase subunit b n=1 Tax=Thiospirillum jenense TaxID=1653858 RepID=A0A839H8J9_9GAMM|nr:F0F1 ATP synthase subunit B [Thiospirillum jenense]MBB1072982.1 F0F1 ATP synthase subunit B [Rhodoferax jenense]MBB1124930.1 F0F1 ATP synthase subunit B [Thiospirillum jenense]